MKASSSAYRRRQTHGHIMLSTPQDGRTDVRADRRKLTHFPSPTCTIARSTYLSEGRGSTLEPIHTYMPRTQGWAHSGIGDES